MIREYKSITQGSRHLFNTIRLLRYLPPVYLKTVNDSILRNAYFALPENIIIISMITDANIDVRKIALNKILAAREKKFK